MFQFNCRQKDRPALTKHPLTPVPFNAEPQQAEATEPEVELSPWGIFWFKNTFQNEHYLEKIQVDILTEARISEEHHRCSSPTAFFFSQKRFFWAEWWLGLSCTPEVRNWNTGMRWSASPRSWLNVGMLSAQHMNSTEKKPTWTWKSSLLSLSSKNLCQEFVSKVEKNKINYFLEQTQVKVLVPGRVGISLCSLQNICFKFN